jgi:lactate dehydrogenase-like 2-hydroxyacid dehydrogenase
MKITEKDFNIQTGEETITERDETPEEIKERELFKAEVVAKAQAQEEAQAKRSIALAKLEALGLDEADLKALGL